MANETIPERVGWTLGSIFESPIAFAESLPNWVWGVVAVVVAMLWTANKFNATRQWIMTAAKTISYPLQGKPLHNLNPASREDIEEVMSLIEAKLPTSKDLGPEETVARREAVADVAEDDEPLAREAVRLIKDGAPQAAFDALEQNARQSGAEKWRRLGALANGIDTARALAAYEEAFRLQSDDFWTCVFLTRLRMEAGSLEAAQQSAQAADEAATTNRDRSVAANTVGDVLVKSGDLAGAKVRFEQCLEIREALADVNPASAEAQRDSMVSYAKMGGLFPDAGWWAKAHAVALRLAD